MATRQIFYLCLLAIPLAAAAAPARAGDNPGYQNLDLPYCSTLSRLHAGFGDGFQSLKGTLYDAGQDLKVWSTNVVLPGARRCDIWQTDAGETLSCEIASAAREEESRRLFQEHVENIDRCLGKEWAKEKGPLPEPGQGLRFLAENSRTGERIDLEVKPGGTGTEYSVDLALSVAPAASTAENAPQKPEQ